MRLGICGLGLIGSSVARGMVARHDVIGIDPDQDVAAEAGDLGVAMVHDTLDLAECDLVLLAAPTSVNAVLLQRLIDTGHRHPVADLGSVKSPIVDLWHRHQDFPFVGSHPMAGSEHSGVGAGTSELFQGMAWPVVIEPGTDPHALHILVEVILALGARVVPVSAESHDRSVAAVSHLPHLVAGAIGATVAAAPHQDLAVGIAGGSFRDGTRVSASPVERTAEFIVLNAGQAASAARVAAAQLQQAADLIDQGDGGGLAEWLQGGARVRASYDALPALPQQHLQRPSADDLHSLLLGHRDSGFAVLAVDDTHLTVVGGEA